MKDKLYKTGHKKAYYRLRRTVRLSLFAIALGLTTAAPVMITYGVETARAAAQKAEDPSEIESSSGVKEESLLCYAF